MKRRAGLFTVQAPFPLLCCFVSLLNSKFKSQLLTDGTEQDRVTVEKKTGYQWWFSKFHLL